MGIWTANGANLGWFELLENLITLLGERVRFSMQGRVETVLMSARVLSLLLLTSRLVTEYSLASPCRFRI